VPCPPFGLVSEVRNGPGTLALRADTLLAMLRDLCADLARNGLTKIVIVNGHGGNQELLGYFLRERLDEERPYALYLFRPEWRGDEIRRYAAMLGLDDLPECGHACIQETPEVMVVAPETVHMDRVVPEETHRLGRLAALREAFLSTSVDWYANYPNQIAGDPTGSMPELGEWLLSLHADKLVRAIRAARADAVTPALLAEYQARSRDPLGTQKGRRP
jgi:creatinine amidohydrolase